MSVKALSWVFHESLSRGTDRLVLLSLADTMNDEGECWLGVQSIADKSRVSKSTARRSLHSLEKIGELVIVKGGGAEAAERANKRSPRGDRMPNAYLMTWTTSQIDTPIRRIS